MYVGVKNGRSAPAKLARLLEEARQHETIVVPYSSAHLDECSNIRCPTAERRDQEKSEHLAAVWQVSGNHYIRYNYVGGDCMVEREVDPRRNEEAIMDSAPRIGSALDWILTRLPDKRFPTTPSFDPRELNNLDSTGVWKHLRENWTVGMKEMSAHHWTGRLWLSARNTLAAGIPSHDQVLAGQIGHHTPHSPMYYATLVNWLDLCGYHSDKRRPSRKTTRARLWDGMHTSFASTCDVFVSGDKRLRSKAAAAYTWSGVTTEVLDVDEASELLHTA